jgi:hypothetical protein
MRRWEEPERETRQQRVGQSCCVSRTVCDECRLDGPAGSDVRHAEEETRAESAAESEVWTGDVEGAGADQRAAGQVGETPSGVERLGE